MNGLTQRGDATELNATIDEAQKLLDSVQVGSAEGQVAEKDYQTLQTAIETAKAVAASTDADAADMEQAIKDLQAAEDAFRAAIIVEDSSSNKPEESVKPDNDNTDNSQNDTSDNTTSDTDDTQSVPQTGDTSRTVGILVTVCLLAAGTATTLVWRRRRAE